MFSFFFFQFNFTESLSHNKISLNKKNVILFLNFIIIFYHKNRMKDTFKAQFIFEYVNIIQNV